MKLFNLYLNYFLYHKMWYIFGVGSVRQKYSQGIIRNKININNNNKVCDIWSQAKHGLSGRGKV